MITEKQFIQYCNFVNICEKLQVQIHGNFTNVHDENYE